MRQVIDRHRTIEQGNVIFRGLHVRFGKRRNLEISSTYGNLPEKSIFAFQSSLNLIFKEIKDYEISFIKSDMETRKIILGW